MSAFVCNLHHINALTNYAVNNHYGSWKLDQEVKDFSPDEIGQVLLDENVKSVNYRYEENSEPDKFTYKPIPNFSTRYPPVQIIKGCDCLIYQSCEHPEYYKSLAYQLTQAIRELAIDRLPGYEAAEWEIMP